MLSTLKRVLANPFKPSTKTEYELAKVYKYPRFTLGYTNIFGNTFAFHDSFCFCVTYREIFENEIYKFSPSAEKRTIIDCGANMGISVAYFSFNYPSHTIHAFEPDSGLFKILTRNVDNLGLKNVVLHNKAVWDKEEKLVFYTDGGMGGRVNDAYKNQDPTYIQAVALEDYIDENVDFLKIDIEGAEDVVLQSCKEKLNQVERIFFEYHNKLDSPQTLHELLNLVKQAGFNYYLKDSSSRQRPFVDTEVICETFDMATNVFCYK